MNGLKRILACVVLASACSGSPTAPPAPAAVVLSKVSAGALGAAGNVAYGAGFTVTETTGKVGFTFNPTITYTLDDGFRITNAEFATHIAAGETRAIGLRPFFDMSGRPPTPRITMTVGFVDDNGHADTMSASANVTYPPGAFTIAGVVTDGTSGGALSDSLVRVTVGPEGPGAFVRSATTDGNGYYSLSTLSTGFTTLSASATGYITTTQSLILSRDTRFDFVLPRIGSPTPPPVPFPTGTCNANSYAPIVTTVCIDGTHSQSQTRAGACVSNQGVACWICPGPLCQ